MKVAMFTTGWSECVAAKRWLRLYAPVPEADIFTHIYSPDKVSDIIRSHRVTTSFVSSLRAPRAITNPICR